MFLPPDRTCAFVTVVQRLFEDKAATVCSVKPVALVGHESTALSPAGAMRRRGGEGGPSMRATQISRFAAPLVTPAAISVKLPNVVEPRKNPVAKAGPSG